MLLLLLLLARRHSSPHLTIHLTAAAFRFPFLHIILINP
jgi:hypothetical protein